MTIHRLQKWEEFKAKAFQLRPQNVFYLSEPHLFASPPLGLRLTFYHCQDMWVFVDHADGAVLAKTGITVTNHLDNAHAEIREQDIRHFISKAFPGVEPVSLPPFIY